MKVADPNTIVDKFHELYYYRKAQTWNDTSWLGVPTQKCPLDLWIYQEILGDVRPRWIIETGTAAGGSALFLASICDLIGHGSVISIDIRPASPLPAHPRIRFITGNSVAPQTVELVRQTIGPDAPVLVILDSDHHCDHVREELRLYSPFVTPDSYLIVEDTNLNGHPVAPEFGPGPREASLEFLRQAPLFAPDRRREKFLISANIGGYLLRVAS